MKVKPTIPFLVSTLLLTSLAFADDSRFVVTEPVGGEQIVTDAVTGLIWQKSYASGKTWQQALAYCEELDYANRTDWRLPNVNELASLINYEIYSPASDFPDMPSSSFWSSSSDADDTSSAWSVYFHHGSVNRNGKTGSPSARCVCAGP